MVSDYINYFRNLAISHKDLQHNPDSETGDGPIGSMHFTKISGQQVLTALRTGIGFPLLCLELYETELKAESVADIKLLPQGAFMIVDNPKSSSAADNQLCYENSERILFDLLKQIWQDHYGENANCDTPFKSFSFNNNNIQVVTNAFSGQHGYRYIFDFELQNIYDIMAPPEPGTFL